MSNNVYANGNAVACKAGDGKVIASFPDVCLSPPPPPAGPIPVPYPDTSFSKDTQEGSKTVNINSSEVMLKDQSYYKTSPLGDEAATRSFGASVLTHVITGKTYFVAWSMDVKIEGQNVDRHLDLTISNCASYPGGTPPFPDAENRALERIKKGKCPCCGKALHNRTPATPGAPTAPSAVDWYKSDTPMNMEEWYLNNIPRKFPNPAQQATKTAELKKLLADAKTRTSCTCKAKTKLLPEPPCDVFFDNPDPIKRKARRQHIEDSWKHYKNTSSYRTRNRLGTGQQSKVNHLTPKAAGGCPTGNKNLQPNKQLCTTCQKLNDGFNQFQ